MTKDGNNGTITIHSNLIMKSIAVRSEKKANRTADPRT
jgi:hypothetical protein